MGATLPFPFHLSLNSPSSLFPFIFYSLLSLFPPRSEAAPNPAGVANAFQYISGHGNASGGNSFCLFCVKKMSMETQ